MKKIDKQDDKLHENECSDVKEMLESVFSDKGTTSVSKFKKFLERKRMNKEFRQREKEDKEQFLSECEMHYQEIKNLVGRRKVGTVLREGENNISKVTIFSKNGPMVKIKQFDLPTLSEDTHAFSITYRGFLEDPVIHDVQYVDTTSTFIGQNDGGEIIKKITTTAIREGKGKYLTDLDEKDRSGIYAHFSNSFWRLEQEYQSFNNDDYLDENFIE